ncbi:hypothetical protein L551_2470 [Bordetella pertussis STO1-SEAT-0004]|nr:hypothetical protein L551_2470 [Bordetella pertussis STO1-SEAT-0004]
MAQPWETANQGLARVDERLLTPPELRSSLRPADHWRLDPLCAAEPRAPGRAITGGSIPCARRSRARPAGKAVWWPRRY